MPVIISIVIRRGVKDNLDNGFAFIPLFGHLGPARAFPTACFDKREEVVVFARESRVGSYSDRGGKKGDRGEAVEKKGEVGDVKKGGGKGGKEAKKSSANSNSSKKKAIDANQGAPSEKTAPLQAPLKALSDKATIPILSRNKVTKSSLSSDKATRAKLASYSETKLSPSGNQVTDSKLSSAKANEHVIKTHLFIPSNVTHFLWEFEASTFIECDLNRRTNFEKQLEKGKKAVMEDKKKIKRAMGLILGEAFKDFTQYFNLRA